MRPGSFDTYLDLGDMGQPRATVHYEYSQGYQGRCDGYGQKIEPDVSSAAHITKVIILDAKAKPFDIADFLTKSAIEDLEDTAIGEEE